MIESVEIANFRSALKCDVRLAPMTILFGPTAAGKSTLLYGLYALRNFVMNPNQTVDGFFNLGFQTLGGFEACVFNHELERSVGLAARTRFHDFHGLHTGRYGIALARQSAEINFEFPNGFADVDLPPFSISADVSIPYPLNQTFTGQYEYQNEPFAVNWNGVTFSATSLSPTVENQKHAIYLASMWNSSVEALKHIDFAPHKRGFFKPSYTPVPLSGNPTTEDEVATLIINDPNMPARISDDAEQIFDRDFRTYVAPGTATVFFQTTQKRSKTPVYLVNDGFGVNQVIYLLAKLHRPETKTLLIEEPEVHLHPTVVRNLTRTFCNAVVDDQKQIILTTHSEQFLISLLTCVSEGLISRELIKCYYVTQEKRATNYQEQNVTENGQLEGRGLASFVEAETLDLKKFLSLAQ